MTKRLRFVFIGLSITSSWGNGHATTFRSLLKGLNRLGHDVLFLECDVPWYAAQRDMPSPDFCRTELYRNLEDLQARFSSDVKCADVVVVGSYVQDGVNVARWIQKIAAGITAFYDIDTPVTLAKLSRGDYEYLNPKLIPGFQMYLSFSGGRALQTLEEQYCSPCARELFCSFDPETYYVDRVPVKWELGYLGTYSDDRQPGLEGLMLQAARDWPFGKFVVAGPQYPEHIEWPYNVERITHLPPSEHRVFYNSQRFTLNITRSDMKEIGYSPSVRLFEAAACGVPIISDWWEGLDELFQPGQEIVISRSSAETLQVLQDMPEQLRLNIGLAARERVMRQHTADHRAAQLESYILNPGTTEHQKPQLNYAAQG